MPITDDAAIARLLTTARTIALVGASDRPDRASHEVMAMLQGHGYRVIPVNPALAGQQVLGETVLERLDQIALPIDIVDVFRRSEAVGPVVDEAIGAGAGAVWMQLGVINPPAAAKAEAAGLQVVMDRCPKIEIRRLRLPKIAA
jgi:predicted CoA-binding protein